MDQFLSQLKQKKLKELEKILSSKLKKHQYNIIDTINGWDVQLSYIPNNLKIPKILHYWDINIIKV